MYFLTVLEAEIQEEGAILVKVWRGPSAGLQTTDFTPLPCVKERERERARELSGVSSFEGTNSIRRAPYSSNSHYLPKASLWELGLHLT
jgi:hypothetical protein